MILVDKESTVNVKLSLFDPEIETKLPTKSTEGSAAFDLYSAYEYGNIGPQEVARIRTNWIMEIPIGYVGKIYSRSGIATKHGISLANGVGIIDSDYRGEVIVVLEKSNRPYYSQDPSISDEPFFFINKNEKIAQIVFERVEDVNFEVVDREYITTTKRGSGGFGHTGRI